jgi:hypothetical protein
MDHVFRHIEKLLLSQDGHDSGKLSLTEAARKQLEELIPLIGRYRSLVEYAAPPGHGPAEEDEQAEVWGLLGAMDRQLAHIQQYLKPTEWRRTMARARRNYLLAASRSLDSPRYSLHYLSVSSLLGKAFPRRWWTIAYSAAQLFLSSPEVEQHMEQAPPHAGVEPPAPAPLAERSGITPDAHGHSELAG